MDADKKSTKVDQNTCSSTKTKENTWQLFCPASVEKAVDFVSINFLSCTWGDKGFHKVTNRWKDIEVPDVRILENIDSWVFKFNHELFNPRLELDTIKNKLEESLLNLKLNTYVSDEVPIIISSDAKRIRQIAYNIVDFVQNLTEENWIKLEMEECYTLNSKNGSQLPVQSIQMSISSLYSYKVRARLSKLKNLLSTIKIEDFETTIQKRKGHQLSPFKSMLTKPKTTFLSKRELRTNVFKFEEFEETENFQFKQKHLFGFLLTQNILKSMNKSLKVLKTSQTIKVLFEVPLNSDSRYITEANTCFTDLFVSMKEINFEEDSDIADEDWDLDGLSLYVSTRSATDKNKFKSVRNKLSRQSVLSPTNLVADTRGVFKKHHTTKI